MIEALFTPDAISNVGAALLFVAGAAIGSVSTLLGVVSVHFFKQAAMYERAMRHEKKTTKNLQRGG